MSIEWVVDKSGTGMRLKRTSKDRYTGLSFDIDAVENMVNFKLSKSGVHWLWDNVRMLMKGEILTDDVEKESSMMEYLNNCDDLPSPRILNNHGYFDEQPSDLLQGKNKVIFLYRNPKDIAVSFYHHHLKFPSLQYTGDFHNFLTRFVDGQIVNSSYFEYLLSFEEGFRKFQNIPYLLVRYEDLHRRPVAERRRIAEFLGKSSYDDTFLRNVHEATTIEVMRQNKTRSKNGADLEVKSVMYRKGKVGDWKETFTANQNLWFDDVINDVMKHSKLFTFVYSIND